MTESNATITQEQWQKLLTSIALNTREMQLLRTEIATWGKDHAALRTQVQAIIVARAEEHALAKGRAQMAKWIWGGAVAGSGTIGGVLTLALNAYLKLGTHG